MAQVDILTKITTQRLLDVAESKRHTPLATLEARVASRYPSAPLHLGATLATLPGMAVASEFKRASPSKGDIVPPGTPVDFYAREYTEGGANILSVLTEPTWFKGSLEDMERVRELSSGLAAAAAAGAASAAASSPGGCSGAPRPLILRKDFILDSYQIMEARAFGADTVLLIVASLPTPALLTPLIHYARFLGMEPLVEVNSVEELGVAVACGAAVLGINNRNLRTFEVDMGTTSRIVAAAASGGAPVAILSLSGIKSGEDVASLVGECEQGMGEGGVMRGFLIGEALMRCPHPAALVGELKAAGFVAAALAARKSAAVGNLAAPSCPPRRFASFGCGGGAGLSAKVCGLTSLTSVRAAVACGADYLGFILVPGSPRTVTPQAVGQWVREGVGKGGKGGSGGGVDISPLLHLCANPATAAAASGLFFNASRLGATASLLSAARTAAGRPLTVGVFRNEPRESVAARALEAGLDCVQLHGGESVDDYKGGSFPLPIIKVCHVPASPAAAAGDAAAAAAEAVAAEVAAAEKVCEEMGAWSHVAALILLDTAGGGGAGVAFNHATFFPALDAAMARKRGSTTDPTTTPPFPVWLAGGLTPETLPSTLVALGGSTNTSSSGTRGGGGVVIHGVDVSSGVEWVCKEELGRHVGAGLGSKDPTRVKAFIWAARAAGW